MTETILLRRLLVAVLTAAMLFVLGGCGRGDVPLSGVSSDPAAESTVSTDATDTTASTATTASTDTTSTTTAATTKATTAKPTTTTTQAPTTTTTQAAPTEYTNPYGVYDVIKTYIGSNAITERQLLPSVAYTVDDTIVDTMFDSFIFLPSPVHIYSGIFTNQEAWQDWIDEYTFLDGKNMDALEAVTGETKKALGRSDYKTNAFVTLINPDPENIGNFGELNGRELDFNNEEDRYEALKWMVDEYIAKFNSKNYQNVRLAGFYWFDEYLEVDRDKALLNRITDYIRSKGYITIYSAFHRSEGYDKWKECGIDLASMQSNYFPSEPNAPNNGPISRLTDTAAIAQLRDMGIELELDNQAKKMGITGFKQTLQVGVRTGYMNGYHVYYFSSGPDAVYTVERHRDPYFRSVYDELYKFIKRTLTLDEIQIDLSE